MILFAVAAFSFIACLFMVSYFGRRTRRLRDDDLRAIPGFEEGGDYANFYAVEHLTPEGKENLKRSFLSGTDFRWLLVGGDGTDSDFDKPWTDLSQKHWDITSYMIECIVRVTESYGDILVCTGEKGEYLGSICLIPPYTSHIQFYIHFIRSVIPLGIPVFEKMNDSIKKRFRVYGDETMRAHKEVMEGRRHWYVACVGVSEAAQGKGIGRKLLNAAAAVVQYQSKKDGTNPSLPMYLECHDGNVAFYEKMGYKRERRYDMKPKMTPEFQADCTPYSYNSMVKYFN